MRKLVSCLAGVVAVASACGAGTGTGANAGSTPASSRPPAATTTLSTSSTSTSTTSTSTTSTSTTTSTTTTTTTTLPRPPVRTIGSRGDSLMLGVIPPLQTALEVSGYEYESQWFVGFLEPRTDERWAKLLAEPPDVLIMLFAPWELYEMRNRDMVDLTDPNWPQAYTRDFVAPRLAQLRGIDTEVIWIGLPPSGDPVESAQYAFLNSIWREMSEDEPRITWLDSVLLLAGPDGRYRDVDDTASPPVRLYQADGRHLCPEGGRRIAVAVLALLEDRFGVEVDPTWTETNWAYNPFAYDVGKCPHND